MEALPGLTHWHVSGDWCRLLLGRQVGVGLDDYTRLEIVPERYVARLGAMKPQPLMAANDFERAPVRVDLTPAN